MNFVKYTCDGESDKSVVFLNLKNLNSFKIISEDEGETFRVDIHIENKPEPITLIEFTDNPEKKVYDKVLYIITTNLSKTDVVLDLEKLQQSLEQACDTNRKQRKPYNFNILDG